MTKKSIVLRDLLLPVWREVCRHLNIRESTSNIAELLTEHAPLACLVVRRFPANQQSLETVATGGPQRLEQEVGTTVAITSGWKRIQTWGNSTELLHAAAQQRAGMQQQLIPPELGGEVLAGPLCFQGRPSGVLLIQAQADKHFGPEHQELLSLLLEPFSVALENDVRLHELEALRDAAEADRRSLLARLGRETIREEVVGAHTGLRLVMERVELVAQSDVPVLILGETGTGKEVVSRAIHNRSPRAEGPFIRVNCGAIPPELIDSQLFGHEKGSFTGAGAQHQGWFERADGGTLFLDEIGELPLPAQVRLLRVLQDHHVERIGSKEPVHVDVRIVAATHRDLSTMVKERSFREDLWYRINVFPILLPRLRERMEDIPALVHHFAQRAAIRFGLTAVEASPSDLHMLMRYPWPGNIRELGAVIDRAAILGNGRTLEIATSLGLSQPLTVQPQPSQEPTYYEVIPESYAPPKAAAASSSPLGTLDEAMKDHIQRALVAARGQIEGKRGAAAVLGINPHTLRARMRKLGITWKAFR